MVEGFHGVPFAAPLARLRETVEVCRTIWRREPAVLDGTAVHVPLPADQGTGLGKPLALVNTPRRDRIPVSIAALTPRSVAQTAEIAEGWLPAFFHPERADAVWGRALAEGAARRDPGLGPLDVHVVVPLAVGGGPVVQAALAAHRARLALYVGGMGARHKNFYAELAAGFGYAEAAAVVQERFLAGDRAGAAAAVPADLVAATSLIGDEGARARRAGGARGRRGHHGDGAPGGCGCGGPDRAGGGGAGAAAGLRCDRPGAPAASRTAECRR